jgi:hypothetical protein
VNTETHTSRRLLREVAAPPGWTAMLLEYPLPIEDIDERLAYAGFADELLRVVPAFAEAKHEEVLLLFERLRTKIDIPVLQRNARSWLPEFGVGVWTHQEPPHLWTPEEFHLAKHDELRPIIERVVRVTGGLHEQSSAWHRMLGTGSVLRVAVTEKNLFLERSTELLQPRMTEPSFTSFPFYVPLLTAEGILAPSPAFNLPLYDLLPGVDAYLLENREDGGILILVREPPELFWNNLPAASRATLDRFDLHRLTPSLS